SSGDKGTSWRETASMDQIIDMIAGKNDVIYFMKAGTRKEIFAMEKGKSPVKIFEILRGGSGFMKLKNGDIVLTAERALKDNNLVVSSQSLVTITPTGLNVLFSMAGIEGNDIINIAENSRGQITAVESSNGAFLREGNTWRKETYYGSPQPLEFASIIGKVLISNGGRLFYMKGEGSALSRKIKETVGDAGLVFATDKKNMVSYTIDENLLRKKILMWDKPAKGKCSRNTGTIILTNPTNPAPLPLSGSSSGLGDEGVSTVAIGSDEGAQTITLAGVTTDCTIDLPYYASKYAPGKSVQWSFSGNKDIAAAKIDDGGKEVAAFYAPQPVPAENIRLTASDSASNPVLYIDANVEYHGSAPQAKRVGTATTTTAQSQDTGTPEKAAAPIITPNGGTFTSSQRITITTATPEAIIYYTADGSDPKLSTNTNRRIYAAPFTLAGTATVKAIVVKSGMTDSDVASAVFTITAARASQATGKTKSILIIVNDTQRRHVDGANVTMRLGDRVFSGATDNNGEYRASVAAGSYRVTVSKSGYYTSTLLMTVRNIDKIETKTIIIRPRAR
ncbi:MAG: chitobiase/beta-hexosaminidase C-terminal domain-containing protein, partial [Candidatus Aenigmarchaeota archaeon]|nr:chitobiase/beta-hexosaminidase C-terminal domain-containing protein [Candidatus Aenigmarchaeota archaeon]